MNFDLIGMVTLPLLLLLVAALIARGLRDYWLVRRLRRKPESTGALMILSAFDKLFLGTIIGLAIWLYDDHKTLLEHEYHDKTLRIDNARQLLPMVLDDKQSAVVRAELLVQLMSSKSIDDASALPLSGTVLVSSSSDQGSADQDAAKSLLFEAWSSRMPQFLPLVIDRVAHLNSHMGGLLRNDLSTPPEAVELGFWRDIFFKAALQYRHQAADWSLCSGPSEAQSSPGLGSVTCADFLEKHVSTIALLLAYRSLHVDPIVDSTNLRNLSLSQNTTIAMAANTAILTTTDDEQSRKTIANIVYAGGSNERDAAIATNILYVLQAKLAFNADIAKACLDVMIDWSDFKNFNRDNLGTTAEIYFDSYAAAGGKSQAEFEPIVTKAILSFLPKASLIPSAELCCTWYAAFLKVMVSAMVRSVDGRTPLSTTKKLAADLIALGRNNPGKLDFPDLETALEKIAANP